MGAPVLLLAFQAQGLMAYHIRVRSLDPKNSSPKLPKPYTLNRKRVPNLTV